MSEPFWELGMATKKTRNTAQQQYHPPSTGVQHKYQYAALVVPYIYATLRTNIPQQQPRLRRVVDAIVILFDVSKGSNKIKGSSAENDFLATDNSFSAHQHKDFTHREQRESIMRQVFRVVHRFLWDIMQPVSDSTISGSRLHRSRAITKTAQKMLLNCNSGIWGGGSEQVSGAFRQRGKMQKM